MQIIMDKTTSSLFSIAGKINLALSAFASESITGRLNERHVSGVVVRRSMPRGTAEFAGSKGRVKHAKFRTLNTYCLSTLDMFGKLVRHK